jgi:hypothetical protein
MGGTDGRELEEICGAEGEVSEDLEVADAVRTELEFGDFELAERFMLERGEIGGLDRLGQT